jgi:hypothetical protein
MLQDKKYLRVKTIAKKTLAKIYKSDIFTAVIVNSLHASTLSTEGVKYHKNIPAICFQTACL